MPFQMPTPEESEQKRQFNFKVRISLYNRLRELCEANGVSMQETAERMLEHCMKDVDKSTPDN